MNPMTARLVFFSRFINEASPLPRQVGRVKVVIIAGDPAQSIVMRKQPSALIPRKVEAEKRKSHGRDSNFRTRFLNKTIN